jgi:hypothetical protein
MKVHTRKENVVVIILFIILAIMTWIMWKSVGLIPDYYYMFILLIFCGGALFRVLIHVDIDTIYPKKNGR